MDIDQLHNQGWTIVEVLRQNLYNYQYNHGWNFVYEIEWGDEAHFNEICLWCEKTFPNNEWSGIQLEDQKIKKFAFKQEKWATLFKIKWV